MRLPISIVIPTHNDARTLPRTVLSVLAQDLCANEIVIVNDAGEDPLVCLTEALGDKARNLRILTLSENLGASGARNAGLAVATGGLILFLDSDDIISPDFLRLASQALAAHPMTSFAIGDGVRCPDAEFAHAEAGLPKARATVPVTPLESAVLFDHVAANPGFYLLSLTLWRREAMAWASQDSWLETRLATDEDFQMYLRTALRHGAVRLEAIMGLHRLRPGSLTKNPEQVWRNRTRAMDLLLAEDRTLAEQPHATERVRALRSNGVRRVAKLLAACGKRTEARRCLREDITQAQSLSQRLKSAVLWLRLLG